MATPTKAVDFAYTDLSFDRSVTLEIDGTPYELVHFTASFTINQVPEAVCMLALGRDARQENVKATAHTSAASLRGIKPARVLFRAEGDTRPGGPFWPSDSLVIFDGYFTGFSYLKANGKVHVVAHLIHWLTDLTFSSSLSQISHPSNPADLTMAAATEPPIQGAGGGGQAITLSQHLHVSAITPLIPNDLWEAIKTVLCAMSQAEGFDPTCGKGVTGFSPEDLLPNDRATRALSRIEGPSGVASDATNALSDVDLQLLKSVGAPPSELGGDCSMEYRYANALPLSLGLREAYVGIAEAISDMPAVELWGHTLWELLVGHYAQQFGFDLCPAVDRAFVAAALGGWRAGGAKTYWREITPDDYDYIDQSALVSRPLRAVVVHGVNRSESGGNQGGNQVSGEPGGTSCLSGIYSSPADDDAGGVILYQQVPRWAANITAAEDWAGDTTGNSGQGPIRTATQPTVPQPTTAKAKPAALLAEAKTVLDKYAQMIFMQNVLRGRTGTVGGRLRFDIAPGSHVKIKADPELFIGAEDALASDLYARVVRVTVEIDAEGRRAGTSLLLDHVRNEAENNDDRTSLTDHPIYGHAIMSGAPLLPEMDLK